MNTEHSSTLTEDESSASDCVTVIEREVDNTPSDVEELPPIDKDDSIELIDQEKQTEHEQVSVDEVHHQNGGVSHKTETTIPLVNGHLSDSDEDETDFNTNHKPLLAEVMRTAPSDSPLVTKHSCSCPLSSSNNSRLISLIRSDTSLSMSESPDIFHIRAPLVSWENFMTPSLSDDSLCGS